jgi:transposase-like protein
VRWYLRYPLAYEHVAELLAERGLAVDASCMWRWVQAYAAELNKRCRPHLKATNKSYRVDETYIKVKGQEKYLYRAVDSTGQTIDFLLTAKRDAASAQARLNQQAGKQNPVSILIDLRSLASRLQSDGSRSTGLVPVSQGDLHELAETNKGVYCHSTGTKT